MCVTICHRQNILYFNHEDCVAYGCLFAGERKPCQTCRHRQGERCGLTRASLPEAGGCCHWNVEPVIELQEVSPAMIEMLLPGANESVCDVLDGFDVLYRLDADGAVWIEPAEMPGLPLVYGVGTGA